MKLVAHPLVVAVALGLVGPDALTSLDDQKPRRAPCTDCTDAEAEALRAEYAPEMALQDAEAEEVELRLLLDEALSLLG